MTLHPSRGLRIHERIYRTAMFLLPRSFRDEFGGDILDAFRDGYHDLLTRLGPRAANRFARRAGLQLIACAARLHLGAKKAGMPKRARSQSPQGVANVVRDVAVAVRGFARKPSFFMTAVLTMGLGIGATTTVFSVVDKVLLRDLPYPDPDRIVYVTNSSHSLPDFQDWRNLTNSFAPLVASRVVDYVWMADGEPRRLRTALVTAGFFELFGAGAFVGNVFHGRSESGVEPAVLSHEMWQTHWGGDPNVIGTQLTINGVSTIVTGVLDPQFQLPEVMVGQTVDVWMPIDESDEYYANRNIYLLEVAGRLQPEQTVEATQAQLRVLAEAQAAKHGDRYLNDDGSVRSETIVSLYEAVTSDVSDTLRLLMGAVGLMLLIACANVANLFLARGTDRHREIALRMALGAGRRRITGQLLVEALVLALAGGVLGVVLAVLGVSAFAQLNPVAVPRIETVTVDGRVLLFTLVVSVVTGVMFGVLPALQGARSDENDALRDATDRTTVGRVGRHIRDALVVAEIAMSLILTAGAAVLFHSLVTAQRTDPGIDARRTITVPLALNGLGPEERLRFSNALMETLAAHPMTSGVGAGVTVPFAVLGGGRCCWFTNFNRVASPETELATVHPITAGYFNALGATITRGRDLTAADRASQPRPAIINAAFAQRMFGDGDPIGGALEMDGTPVTVVGVVADIKHWGLQESVGNDVYVPYEGAGQYFFRYHLVLRTDAPLGTASEIIRSVIWTIKPDLPVESILSMRDQISASIADSRFYSILFAVFAVISLALAAAGVYSSMLYSVGQRYREMGVRLAMGARPSDITKLILTRGSLITATGIVVGLAGAFALIRTIEHLVVGVRTSDLRTMSVAVGLLACVALAACWIPARRASTADPIRVLRFE